MESENEDTTQSKTELFEMKHVENEKGKETEMKIEVIKENDVQENTFRKFFLWEPNNQDGTPSKNYEFGFVDNSIRTTKYTPLTFIPLNLFEQFRRIANFYFLVIACIQLIPGLTNIEPLSSFAPLIFVLLVTMVKEGYEDWRRRKSDDEINHRKCDIIRDVDKDRNGQPIIPKDLPVDDQSKKNLQWKQIYWQDIQVGDLIRIRNDDWIPADIVLLNTSLEEGLCYIQTANLDGETNLKVKQALKETTVIETIDELVDFQGVIECEQPNKDLYKFDGFMYKQSNPNEKMSLNAKQVILRGCKLKNTEWIYGAVVFTGRETKLMKNSRSPPAKRSSVEKSMNIALITIFCFMFSVAIISAGIGISYITLDDWYLHWNKDEPGNDGYNFFWYLGSFLILFSYMIPISLYVSMEIVKLAQTFMLNQDLRMYDEEGDIPAKAKTSNLNEELGQIQYIFSDKTGTLTCNMMDLVKSAIAGKAYELIEFEPDESNVHDDGPQVLDKETLLKNIKDSPDSDLIKEFFILLAVCHTVLPEQDEKDPNKLLYQASSPDEFALVTRAAEIGFKLKSRTLTSVFVEIDGQSFEYEILNINEFNNVRKRMSVVCKTPDGKFKLYCKGADSLILPRVDSNQDISSTKEHLQLFAAEGLRTLCCAVKELTESEYKNWNKHYHDASIALDDRQGKLDAVAEEIEQNMILVGSTAIEDKLQEGVPETIHSLRQSGFNIWVLTGDKKETAINIGFSCKLLDQDVTPIIVEGSSETKKITKNDVEDAITKALDQYVYKKTPSAITDEDTGQYGLIIEGDALAFPLDKENFPDLQQKFLALALKCKTVICCRVTPSQKRDVVRLIRKSEGVKTLSIGDGANDVSMIQEAHVGIGIVGKEGVQAAMASDYAIGQFRFLRVLLQVHGRWSYNRITKLVLYSFYKNMTFALTQFWFNVFAMFSAQNIFDSWIIIVYNVVFTSWPIIIYAVFEQDVSAENSLKYPQLYDHGMNEKGFNLKLLWAWQGNAVYQSLIIFFGCYFIYGDGIMDPNTSGGGIWSLGVFVYTVVIVTVNLKIALEVHHWTWLNHFFTWGSILIWFLYAITYSAISGLSPDNIYHVTHYLWATPSFWLGVIILPIICLFPDVVFRYIQRNYWPTTYDIIQELQYTEEKVRRKSTSKRKRNKPNLRAILSMTDKILNKNKSDVSKDEKGGYVTAHTGFAFDQEPGQLDAMRVATMRVSRLANKATKNGLKETIEN